MKLRNCSRLVLNKLTQDRQRCADSQLAVPYVELAVLQTVCNQAILQTCSKAVSSLLQLLSTLEMQNYIRTRKLQKKNNNCCQVKFSSLELTVGRLVCNKHFITEFFPKIIINAFRNIC